MAIETHIHAFPRHVAGKIYPEAVPVYDKATGRIRIGDGVTEGGQEVPLMSDLDQTETEGNGSTISTLMLTKPEDGLFLIIRKAGKAGKK